MWSHHLNNMAASIEDSLRVKSGPAIDPASIAVRLRAAAQGVELLEAATVAEHARLVPAEIRAKTYGENVLCLLADGGQP